VNLSPAEEGTALGPISNPSAQAGGASPGPSPLWGSAPGRCGPRRLARSTFAPAGAIESRTCQGRLPGPPGRARRGPCGCGRHFPRAGCSGRLRGRKVVAGASRPTSAPQATINHSPPSPPIPLAPQLPAPSRGASRGLVGRPFSEGRRHQFVARPARDNPRRYRRDGSSGSDPTGAGRNLQRPRRWAPSPLSRPTILFTLMV
jgi:hypothetical protein